MTDAGRAVDLAMTEGELLAVVAAHLDAFGWRWTHFRPARTEKGWRTAVQGDKGFPDIVAVRDDRLLFIELKSQRGKLSAEQQEWHDAMNCGWFGNLVRVWRPSDLRSGEVERVLR